MSLNLDTLFKQLQDISSGAHVQLKTSTPTGRSVEPYYPSIPALPPHSGSSTLTVLKGRELAASGCTYDPLLAEPLSSFEPDLSKPKPTEASQ